MRIHINDNPILLPDEVNTISRLVEHEQISKAGTAIALNDKIVARSKWDSTCIKENDKIVVITAAFGG